MVSCSLPSVASFKTYYGSISYCCLGGEFPDGGAMIRQFTQLFRNEHLETQVALIPLGLSFSLNQRHSINLIIRRAKTEGLIDSYYPIIIVSYSQVSAFLNKLARFMEKGSGEVTSLFCASLEIDFLLINCDQLCNVQKPEISVSGMKYILS